MIPSAWNIRIRMLDELSLRYRKCSVTVDAQMACQYAMIFEKRLAHSTVVRSSEQQMSIREAKRLFLPICSCCAPTTRVSRPRSFV